MKIRNDECLKIELWNCEMFYIIINNVCTTRILFKVIRTAQNFKIFWKKENILTHTKIIRMGKEERCASYVMSCLERINTIRVSVFHDDML